MAPQLLSKTNMSVDNSQSILLNAFNRKKARNPSYSKSALARDLGVSSAFVSNIFTAKKSIPAEMYDQFCYALELDSLEKNNLTEALILEKNKNGRMFEAVKNTLATRKGSPTAERVSAEMSVNLLTHWYYLAVLESLSTAAALAGPQEIAHRLGLSDYQLKDAIDFLSSHKMIEKKDGRWIKSESHLYFPVGRSKQSVRHFHKQMIEKAKHDLATKTTENDFKKRAFLGFTFSANPAHIEKIKAKLQTLLSEITIEAGEGPCSEVYQCNLQLFPLSEDPS